MYDRQRLLREANHIQTEYDYLLYNRMSQITDEYRKNCYHAISEKERIFLNEQHNFDMEYIREQLHKKSIRLKEIYKQIGKHTFDIVWVSSNNNKVL